MKKERMYKDTKTWNPFVGCRYQCAYCKPSFQKVVAWIGRLHNCEKCKTYEPHEHSKRLGRIPNEKCIFVCADGDITFAKKSFIMKILEAMRNDSKKGRIWFIQSKNPKCLEQYLEFLPENTYLLTTIETNRDKGYHKMSKAPKPSKRYKNFLALNWNKKIVTIEPILDFDLETFLKWILSIKPKAVFIGYNSRPKAVELPEPEKKKTWQLIHSLEEKGIQVLKKEMRDRRVTKKAYRDL